MPRARSAVVLDVAAAVAGAAVVVALVLIVADAAVWSPPARAAATGDPRTCTDADLALGVEDLAPVADADPATTQRRLALVWRNTATDGCRLEGFGVVDLVGPATPTFGRSRYGSIVGVPREEAVDPPPAVELAPGQTARSVLRWTPPGSTAAGAGAPTWTPDRIVVATPGERRNQSLAWSFGPVLVAAGGVDPPGLSFGPVTGD